MSWIIKRFFYDGSSWCGSTDLQIRLTRLHPHIFNIYLKYIYYIILLFTLLFINWVGIELYDILETLSWSTNKIVCVGLVLCSVFLGYKFALNYLYWCCSNAQLKVKIDKNCPIQSWWVGLGFFFQPNHDGFRLKKNPQLDPFTPLHAISRQHKERWYVHNIFTTNHKWLIIIGLNLNLSLRLFFWPNDNNR